MGADAFSLPALFLLGFVSTLQDLHVRRISNLWIIVSLLYALAVHLFLFMAGNHQEIMWIRQSSVNVLASTIVAVYFWKQNWWGGGDAKLFICYAALIPLWHYPIGYFSYYFASFLLLMLTFIPAAIGTFLHAQYSLIKSGKSIYANFNPSKQRLVEFLRLSVGFTAIFFLSNVLILFLNQYLPWIKDFPIVIWLLSLGFYRSVFKLFQKHFWMAIAVWAFAVSLVVLVPYFNQINIGHILLKSFTTWLIIFFVRVHIFRTIDQYVEMSQNKNMAFAGWMFLGVLIVWFFKF